MDRDPFENYIKGSEPDKRDKAYAWRTAIGLQAVDGLLPSKYLIDIALRNIEGDISFDEAGELLQSYYKKNSKSDIEVEKSDIERQLADINELLGTKTTMHIRTIFEQCGNDSIFGRSVIEEITGLKSSRASDVINLMLKNGIIEPVKGHGKGKYKFK
ncbi:MAG: antitoxin VbhA family protein [Clostridia bacterium]|nr:antitoxin VbhA family protein [Clostridia bacterium]